MTRTATHLDPPEIDHRTLAAALLARAPRAVENAFAAYAPRVQRYFRRYFGPGCDWEDLCQEAFDRFFRHIDQLRDPDAVVGFLYSKCLGVARNQGRRDFVRRLIRLTPTGDLPEIPGAGGWDPEAREAAARLYALLGRLGSIDRSIFITRHVEEMEIAEIAVAHGMSFGTAKRRVAQVTRRMSAKMGRDPVLGEYVERMRKGSSAG
jgi:RNA polymerase sigma-70 factor (ECF subfamily)